MMEVVTLASILVEIVAIDVVDAWTVETWLRRHTARGRRCNDGAAKPGRGTHARAMRFTARSTSAPYWPLAAS